MISIRPAQARDADQAVPLICLTLGGTADLFAESGSADGAERILSQLFVRGGGRFGYRQGFVLEEDGGPRGLLLAFPAAAMTALDIATGLALLSVLGPGAMAHVTRRMLPMTRVHEAERAEYYVGNVGVLPAFQRRGYGTRLMAFAEERARGLGLHKCSLVVNRHNEQAIRLYQSLGYQVVFTGKYAGRLAETEGGYHRMVKDLP